MIRRIGGEDLQAWRIRADSSPENIFRHFALYHEYESGGSVWLYEPEKLIRIYKNNGKTF